MTYHFAARRPRSLFTLAALLSITSCLANPAPAQEVPVWCEPDQIEKLHNDFHVENNFTETSLIDAVKRVKAAAVQREMNLQPGWTRAQFAQAEALHRVEDLRARHFLKPGFTADDWATSDAYVLVSVFRERYSLKPGFREQDLRDHLAAEETRYRPEQLAGVAKPARWPLSYDERAAWAGPAFTNQIGTQYNLPKNWSFEDLYAGVGPAWTATFVKWYGWHKGMTHDQLVTSLGLVSANGEAKKRHLRPHYTVDELLDAAGRAALAQVRLQLQFPDDRELNEANYLAFVKEQQQQVLADQFKNVPLNFTEADIVRSYADEAGERERLHYDLPQDFTEQEWVDAYALSWVASFRMAYSLARNFTESDVTTAISQRVAAGRCPF